MGTASQMAGRAAGAESQIASGLAQAVEHVQKTFFHDFLLNVDVPGWGRSPRRPVGSSLPVTPAAMEVIVPEAPWSKPCRRRGDLVRLRRRISGGVNERSRRQAASRRPRNRGGIERQRNQRPALLQLGRAISAWAALPRRRRAGKAVARCAPVQTHQRPARPRWATQTLRLVEDTQAWSGQREEDVRPAPAWSKPSASFAWTQESSRRSANWPRVPGLPPLLTWDRAPKTSPRAPVLSFAGDRPLPSRRNHPGLGPARRPKHPGKSGGQGFSFGPGATPLQEALRTTRRTPFLR